MHWTKQDIINYYLKNELPYKLWGMNMHYGYWEKGVKTQRQASLRFNQVMASTASIDCNDHVLDAGCGVGGCGIFLAKTFGCKVTGITITPRQVTLSRENAKKAGVSHLVDFLEMDYQKTTFKDGTFSVVWGLESICYADDKKKFIQEAFRVLNDDGRLVVADGFASRDAYQGKDRKLMTRWMDGWVVNNLGTPEQFDTWAKETGFKQRTYNNVTDRVFKTALLMMIASLPFLPFHLIDKVIRIKSYPCDALWNQYFALKKRLWQYGIFFGKKS